MSLSRGKRLGLNTVSSLSYQITAVICGFILPRLVLRKYGSQVNGLINSITQFLHIIAFLELGVGAVVQSSLYKPLGDNDDVQVSRIISSAEKFFTNIVIVLLFYIAILVVFYPVLVNKDFTHIYTGSLIIVISISILARYYLGIVDRLLLTSNQMGYIQYMAQTITLILNTIACAVLINIGTSIHMVQLTTSIIYLLQPMALRVYVNHNYRIDRKISYTEEPIRQKWNGIAQHVAAVVLEQTDIIVLTIFSTLTNVSIYSVYYLVICGVKNLFISLTSGFQALMGEMLAKKEMNELKQLFSWTEWLLHTGTVFLFGCTGVLIVPFVLVYTKGVTDTNYIVPLFAFFLTIAYAGRCLRLPYNILILAAGHYKQTQWNYVIAAILNIFISILTVKKWGLIGVAIGTLCAMLYQTIWMALYDSKHILNIPIYKFVKHILVDAVTIVIASVLTFRIPMRTISYTSWILLAVVDGFIWGIIVALLNFIFYKTEVKQVRDAFIKHFRGSVGESHT